MKRYEQSIRVITAFFSVLLGFGLKALLDNAYKETNFTPIGAVWPCFFASVFLFLRFLLGSNNHLWREYVFPDGNAQKRFEAPRIELVRDFAFLMIFGGFGVAICYAKSLESFLQFNFWLLLFALVWVLVSIAYGWARPADSEEGKRSQRRWWFWAWINLLQLLVLGPAIHCQSAMATSATWISFLPPFNAMWFLAGAYALILLADLWMQFGVLDATPNEAPAMAASAGDAAGGQRV